MLIVAGSCTWIRAGGSKLDLVRPSEALIVEYPCTPNLGGSGACPPGKILNFNLHVMQSGYNLVTFTNQSARQDRCTTFFLPKSRFSRKHKDWWQMCWFYCNVMNFFILKIFLFSSQKLVRPKPEQPDYFRRPCQDGYHCSLQAC